MKAATETLASVLKIDARPFQSLLAGHRLTPAA